MNAKTKKVTFSLINLLGCLAISFFTYSQEANDSANSPSTDNEKNINVDNSPPFSVSSQRLASRYDKEQVLWVPTESVSHLVIKHRAKGRIDRGNVLFFHAQGENPDHLRLIAPLARQLTQLGWTVYEPFFANEDYPISEHSANPNEATSKDAPLEKSNVAKPGPKAAEIELDDLFSKQTSPVFSFYLQSPHKNEFLKAFEKRNWKSKHQRSNIGMLPTEKLEIEDEFVARTITGWIEKQKQR